MPSFFPYTKSRSVCVCVHMRVCAHAHTCMHAYIYKIAQIMGRKMDEKEHKKRQTMRGYEETFKKE